MKVKVAVLQYDCPEGTKESTSRLDEMVGRAAKLGAKLVVAPETAVGEAIETKKTGVDYLPDLAAIARRHKVHLATSYYKKERGGFFEQGYVVGPDGKPVVDHRKIYLAKPEIENLGVQGGGQLKVGGSRLGKLGMLMCKDGFNRYSHFLYERFNELGVEIICVPSWFIGWKELDTHQYVKGLFTYGAFASRAYVLVSGSLNEFLNSFGRSLIISPVRGVLKEGSPNKEEILVEELDLDEVRQARRFDSWWQPKERVI